MSREKPLWDRLYHDPLLIELARRVGYVGFPARELAEKLGALAEGYGAKKLSLALQEIRAFEGNCVLLNPQARKFAFQLLGPSPEQRADYYRNAKEKPTDWDKQPEEAKRIIDPITEGLRVFDFHQLTEVLDKARKTRQGKVDHLKPLAEEQIQCAESELLRRGFEIPKEEEKKRARKKKAA